MPSATRPARLWLAWLCAPLSLGVVQAAQVIEARDGVSVVARIATREPTRIKVEGAAITDVVGNIRSGNCGSAPPPGAPAQGYGRKCSRRRHPGV